MTSNLPAKAQAQAGTLAKMSQAAEGRFFRASDLLLRWSPDEQVPTEVIPHLEESAKVARALIEPASGKEWSLVMESFIGWIERFGIVALPEIGFPEREETLAAIARDYSTALQDLPGDLLREAFARTIANHKWRNLPLFAEVRGYVEYELKERKARFDKINTARFMLAHRPHVEDSPRERERLTDDQKAQVAEIMKTIRGNLQRVA